MKPRSFIRLSILFSGLLALSNVVAAASVPVSSIQQGPGRGPVSLPRDPELEKQSYHNLEVAKYYFYKRKPDKKDKDGWERLNKAVEGRLMEILDSNPNFGRTDDVYFMLGEVYKRMGEQDKAIQYWTRVTKEYPDSELKADVEKRLEEAKTQNKDKKG